jgi:hypothetical protein
MSGYKPMADVKAIEHLDWALLCEVHLHRFHGPGAGEELEPPCTSAANLMVTYHHMHNCANKTQFMCSEHFKAIFFEPSAPRNCLTCGKRRFIEARPVPR